jgi:hypothetical protein
MGESDDTESTMEGAIEARPYERLIVRRGLPHK